METKKEIESRAKGLIESKPDEALKLYRTLYDDYLNEFNEWDAFFSIKTMRGSTNVDLDWAHDLALKFKNEKIGNLYGWLIFDKCIKGRNKNEIIRQEKYIEDLHLISSQKNLQVDDTFPCPTTISILKLCDANAENLFNAKKISELLTHLDYNLLSTKSKTSETKEKGNIEIASDFEKYFALKTKALFKLGEFTDCIQTCETCLNQIRDFHYNNDLWFKMRIALSEDKLGNHELSETLLQELLSSKAGSDKWFLYRDIAEVYFEQGDFNKAWKYTIDATFYGNEPHFLIGLYLLQARILFKLKRSLDGKIIAELIAAILKEHGWKDKTEYEKLFSFYSIDRNNLKSVSVLIKDVQIFWNNERYGNIKRSVGCIVSIHNNGKLGRIKTENGLMVDFHKKDLQRKLKSIDSLKGSIAEFYIMKTIDGKSKAESIEIIKQNEANNNKDLTGKIFEGVIKNVTDFGIFINFFGKQDGLLHKNNLPSDFKNNFKDKFKVGHKINVKVIKIAEKGIQLKLHD